MKLELLRRPRRLRQSESIRMLVEETTLRPQNFIQPLFVIEGENKKESIASMPNIFRLSVDLLVKECEELFKLGIRGVALFPQIDNSLKDEKGTQALNEKALIIRAAKAIKAIVPKMIIVGDIALDPYTSHGHDGILNEIGTDVDNDGTVEILSKMAVLYAKSGIDWVAPSDMMDGRVGAIRKALDDANCEQTCILSYTAKYASSFYAPFRDAVGSFLGKPISKKTYQIDPMNRREALLEAELDEEEGADILMIKPATLYLDVIREIRNKTTLPVAAYQVSGEYSQLYAAVEKGWLDLKSCRDEGLIAIKRAGADIILSYFAKEWAEDYEKKL